MSATPKSPPGPIRPSVTFGVEVELAIFSAGAPVGQMSHLPAAVIAQLGRKRRCRVAGSRPGYFFTAGLLYAEMGRFLEAASWPAATVAGAMRQEEAILELARVGCEGGGVSAEKFCAACFPDDVSGMPARKVRGRDPDGLRVSASMGTHMNLHLPGLTPRAREMFAMLAALLPEIVGPGGFVRSAGGDRIEFWRDPRAAHVMHETAQAAHAPRKPILKATDLPQRIQIVGLGWTASRIDRLVKYGLLMLLGAAVARGDMLPDIRLCSAPRALASPPGWKVRFLWRGAPGRATRAELLAMLLDEVLEPQLETPEGAAVEAAASVGWARRALAAVSDVNGAPVAARLPTSWALKECAFEAHARSRGIPFARHGERWTGGAQTGGAEIERLAVLSTLEANILNDGVRRWLLASVPGLPWSFSEVYGQDGDVAAALREDRPAAGAARAAEAFMDMLAGRQPPVIGPDPEGQRVPIPPCTWAQLNA